MASIKGILELRLRELLKIDYTANVFHVHTDKISLKRESSSMRSLYEVGLVMFVF